MEPMKASNIKNFGVSLKGNVDLDDDGHPDLIIGAKDLAIVVRARPVISITSQINILGTKFCIQ